MIAASPPVLRPPRAGVLNIVQSHQPTVSAGGYQSHHVQAAKPAVSTTTALVSGVPRPTSKQARPSVTTTHRVQTTAAGGKGANMPQCPKFQVPVFADQNGHLPKPDSPSSTPERKPSPEPPPAALGTNNFMKEKALIVAEDDVFPKPCVNQPGAGGTASMNVSSSFAPATTTTLQQGNNWWAPVSRSGQGLPSSLGASSQLASSQQSGGSGGGQPAGVVPSTTTTATVVKTLSTFPGTTASSITTVPSATTKAPVLNQQQPQLLREIPLAQQLQVVTAEALRAEKGSGAEACPENGIFQAGTLVEYKSRSSGKWILAKVLGYDDAGQSPWYRLDVQPRADPQRVRARGSGGPDDGSPNSGEKKTSPAAGPAGAVAPSSADTTNRPGSLSKGALATTTSLVPSSYLPPSSTNAAAGGSEFPRTAAAPEAVTGRPPTSEEIRKAVHEAAVSSSPPPPGGPGAVDTSISASKAPLLGHSPLWGQNGTFAGGGVQSPRKSTGREAELEQENAYLRRQNAQLQQENDALKEKVTSLSQALEREREEAVVEGSEEFYHYY